MWKIKFRSESSTLWEGIGAVLFFGFALLILLSIVSYDPLDPSFFTQGTSQKINNFIGIIGAYFSDFLIQIFGINSFLIPLVLFLIGKDLWRGKIESYWFKAFGFLIFILTFSSLIQIFKSEVYWKMIYISGGGLTGKFFSELLEKLTGKAGAIIILIVFSLVSFSIFSGITIKKVINFTIRSARYVYYLFSRLFSKEKVKEKKEIEKEREIVKKKIEKVPLTPPEASSLFPEYTERSFTQPSPSLLDKAPVSEGINKKELNEKIKKIEEKLREFNIEGSVVEIHPGPVITTFEYRPDPGIKISQILSLTEDLSLALKAESIMIERIPNKESLGIEVPNEKRERIYLRDIIESEEFKKSPSKLTIAIGKMVRGEIFISDLSIMPHLLIAGATGSGKSVSLNCIITSLFFKASPDELKLILIDPKRVEFAIYNDIPYLITPVIVEPKMAINALKWAVREMKERNRKLQELTAKNIEQYNMKVEQILQEGDNEALKEELKPLPYIVIIIDELADLMVGKGNQALEVENCITSLSQMARAVGIHLVISTQRPSIDILTGTIKNNLPCRIALRVPTKVDSRVIIDQIGAEKLLGNGDMLFMPTNSSRIIRLHGAYISETETARIVKFLKDQGKPRYDTSILKEERKEEFESLEEDEEIKDEIWWQAVELVIMHKKASASFLQTKLKIGFPKAARLIDRMEAEGIVGPAEGQKPREVLVGIEYLQRRRKGF
ncbi:MAG: DNA translocase FtsK [Candidatus Aminicenantia bacterium]